MFHIKLIVDIYTNVVCLQTHNLTCLEYLPIRILLKYSLDSDGEGRPSLSKALSLDHGVRPASSAVDARCLAQARKSKTRTTEDSRLQLADEETVFIIYTYIIVRHL